MELEIRPLLPGQAAQFKRDMQAAFQLGAAEGMGMSEEELVLPEADIDRSLDAPGGAAYAAMLDGEMVGGAIVDIDPETHHNHLEFLYVKNGVHNRGIGRKLWQWLEARYPETVLWETCTPYFDRRNLHFYINRCGFHAVEFFCPFHPDPNDPDSGQESEDAAFGGMFRFEKAMHPERSEERGATEIQRKDAWHG